MNESVFSILYLRHKAYIIPGVIILICVFIFLILVTRQIQDVSFTKTSAAETKEHIRIIKDNAQYLSLVDASVQDQQLKTTTNTLPGEKDFTGVLNAIAQVSSKTGISVSDYSFQVGDITKISKDIPSSRLSLSLSLQTDAFGLVRFLNELAKTVPLSDVDSVKAIGATSTVNIGFYYRPYSLAKTNFQSPIKNVSLSDNKLLEEISSWQTSLTE